MYVFRCFLLEKKAIFFIFKCLSCSLWDVQDLFYSCPHPVSNLNAECYASC